MAHRRLRPWAAMTATFIIGVVCTLMFIICLCGAFEALTGFNPMWLMGSM